jgi:epoxyqueuosine reductase
MYINDEIEDLLKTEIVDYVGYALLEKYETELVKFGGKIVSGYKYGISIGISLPNSIVDHLSDRNDNNVLCEYKYHCYNLINDRLNIIASKVSSFLNQKGYKTLPIVASERTNVENAIPTVSHKMIAHIAGLGWIGKSCLLITPNHGPRVRFVSLLTNAPLKAVDNPIEQKCNDCVECMMICPAKAIKGKKYEIGKEREDRFNFIKCQEYFAELKGKMKWDVCGMCLYVCPYGKKQKSN